MLQGSPTAPFYIYDGPEFPAPDALLACRGLKRIAPLDEPMAQFYAEKELHRALVVHPQRVRDPAQAALFYVPVLPHLSQDAGGCNGTGHRARMSSIATTLRASPHWQRHNGTDHFWACTCVMMKSMLTNELWPLLGHAVHAVHSVPRGHASPSRCQLAIPYLNPSFTEINGEAWRVPGRDRPTLAHFRGRVMNRVRSSLVKGYGGRPAFLVEAASPSTAARCNLNKCSQKAKEKVGFPTQRQHFDEMTRSTFCLVPVGDSPPSSRLYMAIAAGCVPVIISDKFEGVFPSQVPWRTFTLRFKEAQLSAGGRRAARLPSALNLTAELIAVSTDGARLRAMQTALQTHAADVLWEAPQSRVGNHALGLATRAVQRVCKEDGLKEASVAADEPGPQIHWAPLEPVAV